MLRTLQLFNIRSYESGLFQFSEGVNIVVGANASGKTNLLESIYTACTGEAFRSDDQYMVRSGTDWGKIEALFDEQKHVVKFQGEPIRKSFVFDDIEKKRFDGTKAVPVVLFEPSHMQLLAGEPDKRRQYIDTLLSQTNLQYAKTLKDYKRTLAQRNRLLKQDFSTSEHLFVWNVRLSELASQLVEQRQVYMKFLQEKLEQNYRSVSGGEDLVSVAYASKLPLESYASTMLAKLNQDIAVDKARGFTGVGPHRDDLVVTLNGSEAKVAASRGETRSIVLALKIAELQILQQLTARKPLLLLDDVFSELDGKRRRTLAETLQRYQTFITTTDADVVMDHFGKTCNIIPL